jgi:hypothetical protein
LTSADGRSFPVTDYVFVTRWHAEAPIAAVWDLISQPEDWPRWWHGVESVELLEPGGEGGVGSLRRFRWKSRLPYCLAFRDVVMGWGAGGLGRRLGCAVRVEREG